MVKQPDLYSPKFGATSSHIFTQSPQNFAVEPGIQRLAFGTGASRYRNCCIDSGTSLEYLGYTLLHHSGWWIVFEMVGKQNICPFLIYLQIMYELPVTFSCYRKEHIFLILLVLCWDVKATDSESENF
jgi:hypothetical protein